LALRIVIMGVAGCGKSTVGAMLAEKLGLIYIEGDDFHPAANRAKMAAGEPLTDADRWPWLAALAEVMAAQEEGCVVSCSALKRSYRDVLSQVDARVVFLDVSAIAVLERVRQREHFFPESLVASQFETLEPPPETEALRVDAESLSPAVICETLLQQF
jgi:gluconokinase